MLTKSLAPFQRSIERLVQRSYRKQLLANKVSIFRVLVCGGSYAEYRQLQHLYEFIELGKTSIGNSNCVSKAEQDAIFWDSYWTLIRNYQPWVVAHFHRTRGLNEGDNFYINPKTGRTWLYSDMSDFDIPCGMIWDWLYAAAPQNLESTCLLSSFSHKALFGELRRRIEGEPDANQGYLFASMAMAMVFRLGLGTLAEAFAREAHEWKTMYASWDLESRLFLLSVLACLDRQESRDYMYAWGPDLFPEASGMLEVARATDVHPALLLRQWYDQRGAVMPESLAIEGLV